MTVILRRTIAGQAEKSIKSYTSESRKVISIFMPVPLDVPYRLKACFRGQKWCFKPKNRPFFEAFHRDINILAWSDPKVYPGKSVFKLPFTIITDNYFS